MQRSIKTSITTWDSTKHEAFKVIGIFKDYYVYPLHEIQENTGIVLSLGLAREENPFRYFFVKSNGPLSHLLVGQIKKVFKHNFPNTPFDLSILEETVRSDYAKDEMLRSILLIFSTLAIILSFLGLFALLSLLLIRKTKEIGIRKIMGASVANLFPLYAKNYLQLIFSASVLPSPLSGGWLTNG